MKIVAAIACSLLLLTQQHAWASDCPKITQYNSIIATLCELKDLNVLWPNYANVHEYYRCLGEGKPILENCSPDTLFDFTNQKCSKCSDYIPAPPCQMLKGKSCKSFTPLPTTSTTTTKPPCSDLATYTTTFIPACDGVDIYMLWPNYKNISNYYLCQGFHNPKMNSCPHGKFFNYTSNFVLIAGNMNRHRPAGTCHFIRVTNASNCKDIELNKQNLKKEFLK